MIVYYFVNLLYGLKDIRERRLKVSAITDLNDPFDFLAADCPTRDQRRILREWRQGMHEKIGLICFSRNWRSPVQWAHYADRHGGLCLGFEVPSSDLRQVSYVLSRPQWPSSPYPWAPEESSRLIDQLIATKFAHWSYEDEFRLFTTRQSPDPVDGLFYLNFSERLKLVQVMVGDRCAASRGDVAGAIGALPDVEVIKVRPAFRSFRMVRQQKAAAWK